MNKLLIVCALAVSSLLVGCPDNKAGDGAQPAPASPPSSPAPTATSTAPAGGGATAPKQGGGW